MSRAPPFWCLFFPSSREKPQTRKPNVKNQSADLNAANDPHHYTSGRWLHNDQLERDARYINFDFAALCNKAVNVCQGAEKVVRYEKKEGLNHRVFVLFLDNGSRLVAKVPYRHAGRPMLATNSEVATMAFSNSKGLHKLAH